MVHFKRTISGSKDFLLLVSQLDKELWNQYGEEQKKFDVHNIIDKSARVILAYEGNSPVGCGCFRPMEEEHVMEIKRMYTIPGRRGHGIARKILFELEEWGKEEGFLISRLETGIKQPDAIAVYTKSGYARIENYGWYKESSYSICMEKVLTSP